MEQAMKCLVIFALQVASLGSLFGQNGVQFAVYNVGQEQQTSWVTAPVPADSAASPHCETLGIQEIKITCTYTRTSLRSPRDKDEPRIVLNRAVLSFGTKGDSYMLVELTLTNEGASLTHASYAAYLAVDEETGGQNILRRVLPKVDFSELSPGVSVTFSERLLVGGFRAGRYKISLLIPNSAASLRDNPAYNILLNSEGVADPSSGSNTIVHFTVGPSNHSSRD